MRDCRQYTNQIKYNSSVLYELEQLEKRFNDMKNEYDYDFTDINQQIIEIIHDVENLQEEDTNINSRIDNVLLQINNVNARISTLKDSNLQNDKYVAFTNQSLTEEQKGQARSNIGAGSSAFSGNYTDLTGKPSINTTNENELTPNVETIQGQLELHKISKTGSFNDLRNQPDSPNVQLVEFDCTLNGQYIDCRLVNSLSTFEFKNQKLYMIHLLLPITILSSDLNNNYLFRIYDKNNNVVVINSALHKSSLTSSSVGDMCSLQNYDLNTGFEWYFSARYNEFESYGNTYRILYTTDITRESNPAMSGSDLYVAIANGILKSGTCILCTTDYTNSGVSYSKGAIYKITSQIIDGELVIDTEELHDMTREDISHKKSVLDSVIPSATDYLSELGVFNNFATKTGSNLSSTDITAIKNLLNYSNIDVLWRGGLNGTATVTVPTLHDYDYVIVMCDNGGKRLVAMSKVETYNFYPCGAGIAPDGSSIHVFSVELTTSNVLGIASQGFWNASGFNNRKGVYADYKLTELLGIKIGD